MSKYDNGAVKGILRTAGTRFVNGEDEEVILHGYGAANWENVEGFMIGGPNTPPEVFKFWLFPGKGKDHNPERWTCRRTVSQVIRELCGPTYLETFWDRWEENYMKEEDIKLMADLGYNCVRVVLNANALLIEDAGINFNEKGFRRLTNVIDWCEKYRLYVILDMHGVVGGNNGATGDSLFCEYPSIFMDAESKERQIILWEEIVRRYHERDIIAGYDLINEPVSSPIQHEYAPLLDAYYTETIERLRKIDPVHIMFIEPAKYAKDVNFIKHAYDPEYNNWAISIHMYGASPEIKELYPWLLLREEYNVPLWLGECGAGPASDPIFYDICAHYGIAYTPWAFKTAANPFFGTRSVGYKLPKNWEKFQNYVLAGPRPSYKEAQEIMDEYLENIKLENCEINYDTPRTAAKSPDITLAGVGYDMWTEDGRRYYGNWELSNYLDFRLEDHTKLVWASDKMKPYEQFRWYDDPNQIRHDPLRDLALELSAGEFANYTVKAVKQQCTVTVEGTGEAEAEVFANGIEIGTISLPTGDILAPVKSETLKFDAAEEATIKVVVTKGTLTIKNMIFKY